LAYGIALAEEALSFLTTVSALVGGTEDAAMLLDAARPLLARQLMQCIVYCANGGLFDRDNGKADDRFGFGAQD
jgi:hypothetical protein